MAEHRFYIGSDAPAGEEMTLRPDTAHRIAGVLRMRPGERLALFGGGREFECEIVAVRPNVRVRMLEELPAARDRARLTLYQALIRPSRFEWLVEKATEIGVVEIVPLLSERAAVRAVEIGPARLERWRRIAIEATEQSGRRCPPAISAVRTFPAALEAASGRRVFAWEGLRGESSAPVDADGDEISLFVGPEGGWSDAEVDSARGAGVTFMSLGPNLLRAETAAIVASALLLTRL